jgi:hypothetical protein
VRHRHPREALANVPCTHPRLVGSGALSCRRFGGEQECAPSGCSPGRSPRLSLCGEPILGAGRAGEQGSCPPAGTCVRVRASRTLRREARTRKLICRGSTSCSPALPRCSFRGFPRLSAESKNCFGALRFLSCSPGCRRGWRSQLVCCVAGSFPSKRKNQCCRAGVSRRNAGAPKLRASLPGPPRPYLGHRDPHDADWLA